jgi:hypothetical protein
LEFAFLDFLDYFSFLFAKYAPLQLIHLEYYYKGIHPVNDFIENAVELDVDLLCDSEDVCIGGILEHI